MSNYIEARLDNVDLDTLRAIALCIHLDDGTTVPEVDSTSYDGLLFDIGNRSYYVVTEEEGEQRAVEYCKQVFEDCYELDKMHWLLQKYLDLNAAAQECVVVDGVAHSLASYDGYEYEISFRDAEVDTLYIYRAN